MDGEILRITRSVLLSNTALIDSAVKKIKDEHPFFPPSFSLLPARPKQNVQALIPSLITPPDGDRSLVAWWRHGAVGAVGEPGLAAAQRLSVPSRHPRGFAGPAALPVLPCGPKQHTGNRQVCVCVSKTARYVKLHVAIE